MASVALLGGFLVLVSVVVAARTMSENRHVGLDRTWEQALQVAESGIDQALFELEADNDITEVTFSSPSPDKAEVVAHAEAVAADPAEVLSTPEGDVVIVKDDTAEIAYAVGFTPSIDAAVRKERVLYLDYQWVNTGTPWVPDGALIVNGDLEVLGDAAFKGAKGNVHSNKKLDLSGSASVDGCGTGVDPVEASGTDCPPLGDIVEAFMPAINPLAVHKYAQIDICRGGVSFGAANPSGFYEGPASTLGNPATEGEPCSGAFISTGAGNQILGIGSSLVAFDWNSTPGAYYVDGADVTINGKNNMPVIELSVFAGTVDGATDCSTSRGNIDYGGYAYTQAYPGSGGYSTVAGGDLQVGVQVNVVGVVAMHEQFRMNGQATIVGPVVAEDACDSAGSPVSENRINGGGEIIYDGGWISDFELKDLGAVDVENTRELGFGEL